MGLVLDSTFDRLANAVQRFAKFGLSNWFDIACCFKFRKTICLHIFRLLANKGNSLQRLLSPLMPVSVLLQLSDLVFASDLVIGGFFYLNFTADIFVNLPFFIPSSLPVRIDAPVLQLHAEDDRSILSLKCFESCQTNHFVSPCLHQQQW